jgi:hypothetical protein
MRREVWTERMGRGSELEEIGSGKERGSNRILVTSSATSAQSRVVIRIALKQVYLWAFALLHVHTQSGMMIGFGCNCRDRRATVTRTSVSRRSFKAVKSALSQRRYS